MPTRSSDAPRTHAFAAVLRQRREEVGLTQAELADRAGIGVRTVSNLERGINTSPYPSTVRLLADALELSEGTRAELLTAAARRTSSTQHPAPTGGYLGARPPTTIIGREDELATINAALDAAAGGAGGVVLLAGEPGIGKTRLAQEAMAAAAARGFVVASGRCFEQQVQVPFVPLLEVFATLHLEVPDDMRDDLLERLPALAALLPDAAPTPEPSNPAATDAALALHRAALALVREIAATRPVAIVVDDLHWTDDASADLLLHLARHTNRDRVLLLGTYREAEVGSTHPIRPLAHALRRERLTQALALGRLDRDATARLVSQRLDAAELDADVGDLVHRSAEGNPFFTAEIVTALIERGDLAQVDGRWVCRELTEVTPPLSVSEAIGQRFSRLSDDARALLEAASLLGAELDPGDVPTGSRADDVVEQAWDEAVASGLLAPAEAGYVFDHSLTQQALQLGIAPVRRRRLHREIGELLERRPAAARRRRAAEIARHLKAGDLPERALPYAMLAGEAAAAAHAPMEAVRLFVQARELAAELGDEATVTAALEHIGQVGLSAGRYDEALDHLLLAADRHRRSRDVAARLRIEGLVADLQHRRGEGRAAADRLDDVLAELEEDARPDGWVAGGAALANGLARVRLFLGEHQQCLDATELAMRLARQEGSSAAEAEACAVGGTTLFFLDSPEDAVRVLEKGVALAATADAPSLESSSLMGLQWAATMRGDLDRSLELGRHGLELTRRAGNTDQESQHEAGLGHALFYRGEWDAAADHLERAVELARAGSSTLFSGIPPLYLGLLRAAQGDTAAAIASYDEAASAPDLQTFAFAGYLQARRAELDLADDDGVGALARLEPWLEDEAPTKVHDANILVVATTACLALEDLERARELGARAVRRAEAVGNQVDRVDALRLLGRCHRRLGEDDGDRLLQDALALAREIGFPAAEARVRAELG